MRFVYGLFALIIWSTGLGYVLAKGASVPIEAQVLSLAIVAAGAMAGGD